MPDAEVDERFFIGAAVVVDDKVDDEESGMLPILEQITQAGMPIVTRTDLPPDVEIEHWRAFSLIVLDWELFTAGRGVSIPEDMVKSNADRVAAFVGRLLTDLYCPIFILSNQDVGKIERELSERLTTSEAHIAARVRVRSKASASKDLFVDLSKWVRSHTAIYALKRWESGYESAKRQMFSDFEVGSTTWPRILWAASVDDGANPHFELTETISRNILHRFEALVFDRAVLEATDPAPISAETVCRVLHRRAVIANDGLHSDVIMPGDFFALPPARGRHSRFLWKPAGLRWKSARVRQRTESITRPANSEDQILINVTPACDLVQREPGKTLDDVVMTLLRGTLVPLSEFDSKTRMKAIRKSALASEVVWLLREDGRPYRIEFKGWAELKWRDLKAHRVGRLLDPYFAQLRQRFATHFERQGLPSLPESFFTDQMNNAGRQPTD